MKQSLSIVSIAVLLLGLFGAVACREGSNVQEFTAGYGSINGGNTSSALWFLFYEAKNTTEDIRTKIPIIIWLQGGPGWSSLYGAYKEFGPVYLESSGKEYFEKARKNSWNDIFHLLFIDNPIGTGYSIAANHNEIPKNCTKAAEHFYNALVEMFKHKLLPYAKNPIYVMGEGFAGRFIPEIGRYILEQNEKSDYKIDLQGIAIGNGLVDPINQMSENGMFSIALGLVTEQERQQVEQHQLDAVLQIKHNLMNESFESQDKLFKTITLWDGLKSAININNYRRYRDNDEYDDLNAYFEDPVIKSKFQVDPKATFTMRKKEVFEALKEDYMQSSVESIAWLLNKKFKVLIYQGQNDIQFNTPSQQNWLERLWWYGRNDWNELEMTQLTGATEKEVLGNYKEMDHLFFTVIFDAGHHVPQDKLEVSLEMMEDFIVGRRRPRKGRKMSAVADE